MTSKNELKMAYGVAIVLFVVGVISYAAFSAKVPDEPPRVIFPGAAGKVFFTHEKHIADWGYSLECSTCHHHPSDGSDTRACASCHLRVEGGIAEGCMECHENEEHEGMEIATKKGTNYYPFESCLDCHEADRFASLPPAMTTDSLHTQCISCHEVSKAGPRECNECHM